MSPRFVFVMPGFTGYEGANTVSRWIDRQDQGSKWNMIVTV